MSKEKAWRRPYILPMHDRHTGRFPTKQSETGPESIPPSMGSVRIGLSVICDGVVNCIALLLSWYKSDPILQGSVPDVSLGPKSPC